MKRIWWACAFLSVVAAAVYGNNLEETKQEKSEYSPLKSRAYNIEIEKLNNQLTEEEDPVKRGQLVKKIESFKEKYKMFVGLEVNNSSNRFCNKLYNHLDKYKSNDAYRFKKTGVRRKKGYLLRIYVTSIDDEYQMDRGGKKTGMPFIRFACGESLGTKWDEDMSINPVIHIPRRYLKNIESNNFYTMRLEFYAPEKVFDRDSDDAEKSQSEGWYINQVAVFKGWN